MARRTARAGALALLLALCAAGIASAAQGKASCSIRGLGVASVKVSSLRVRGVSCSSARTVAGKVAADLAHGRSISVPGSVGFAMAQQSCIGCGGTTTSVTITYPHGSLAISLRGGSRGGSTTPIPSRGSPGDGSVI